MGVEKNMHRKRTADEACVKQALETHVAHTNGKLWKVVVNENSLIYKKSIVSQWAQEHQALFSPKAFFTNKSIGLS